MTSYGLWRHNNCFHCCWCLLQFLHFALWKVSSTKRCILWCDQEHIVTSEVLNTFLSDVNVLLSGIWREQLCLNFHRFPLQRRLNQLLQQDDIRCCNDDLRNTVFRGRVLNPLFFQVFLRFCSKFQVILPKLSNSSFFQVFPGFQVKWQTWEGSKFHFF